MLVPRAPLNLARGEGQGSSGDSDGGGCGASAGAIAGPEMLPPPPKAVDIMSGPNEPVAGVRIRHVTITTSFLLLSTALALTVHDLGVILSVVGATGSTAVSYILPGGCYYLLFRAQPGPKRALALVQCMVGFALVPLLLALIYRSARL